MGVGVELIKTSPGIVEAPSGWFAVHVAHVDLSFIGKTVNDNVTV